MECIFLSVQECGEAQCCVLNSNISSASPLAGQIPVCSSEGEL